GPRRRRPPEYLRGPPRREVAGGPRHRGAAGRQGGWRPLAIEPRRAPRRRRDPRRRLPRSGSPAAEVLDALSVRVATEAEVRAGEVKYVALATRYSSGPASGNSATGGRGSSAISSSAIARAARWWV